MWFLCGSIMPRVMLRCACGATRSHARGLGYGKPAFWDAQKKKSQGFCCKSLGCQNQRMLNQKKLLKLIFQNAVLTKMARWAFSNMWKGEGGYAFSSSPQVSSWKTFFDKKSPPSHRLERCFGIRRPSMHIMIWWILSKRRKKKEERRLIWAINL